MINGIVQSVAYSILKCLNLPGFPLPACQPAVRPGYAKCTAPEVSHNRGNCSGFTKLLIVLINVCPLCYGDSFYPL